MWQAAVRRTPVAMAVANFGGLPGLVCSLDEEGALTLLYQGTDPPTSTVAPDRKEVDYEQINEEHHKLLQVNEQSSDGGPLSRRRVHQGRFESGQFGQLRRSCIFHAPRTELPLSLPPTSVSTVVLLSS